MKWNDACGVVYSLKDTLNQECYTHIESVFLYLLVYPLMNHICFQLSTKLFFHHCTSIFYLLTRLNIFIFLFYSKPHQVCTHLVTNNARNFNIEIFWSFSLVENYFLFKFQKQTMGKSYMIWAIVFSLIFRTVARL